MSVPWAVPPQSGDPSAVHLLHEALRFVLARRGFTVSPAAPALPRADRRHHAHLRLRPQGSGPQSARGWRRDALKS